MPDGLFKYEDCLLKHYIRTTAWLPICKSRLKAIRGNKKITETRRLRYFTFCAVGAVDVLMLDVAKVIRPSRNTGKFDTVFFFDRNSEHVLETLKRVPGAMGFPGDFIKIVLMQDPKEHSVIDEVEGLLPIDEEDDEFEVREKQRRIQTRRDFISHFPFDVINLDLEEFLFKPNDTLPGDVVRAMRKLFEWQKRPLKQDHGVAAPIDGFSLMFTTQIGPPNIAADYLTMLRETLQSNLQRDTTLSQLMINRVGHDNVIKLQGEDFENFFRLSVPKLILAELMQKDWYIDPVSGISVHEIIREYEGGQYKLIHLVMDVKRKNPPEERRYVGQQLDQVEFAYQEVVRRLISNHGVLVTNDVIDPRHLERDLNLIKARRKKYYNEG